MYKTILVPLDNSEADATILQHVRPLARLCGSRLILMHVADGFAARTQEELNLADSEEIRQDRAYLAARAAELIAEGFDADNRLCKGDPAEQIVRLAEQEKCDLIAMSTHGHGMIMDALLGTVASNVRHRTEIPVLLVRSRARNG